MWMQSIPYALIIRRAVRVSDLNKLKSRQLRILLKIFEIKDFAITNEIILSNSAFHLRKFFNPTLALLSLSNLVVFLCPIKGFIVMKF
jgi:hypothetical protein